MANTLLLIWEGVLESQTVYALDASSEQAAWARASAGKFINDDIPEDHDIYKLEEWLATEAPEHLDHGQIIIGEFSEVVICGCFW